MKAKVGDGWVYTVILNGTNVSNVATEAVSILGWGYVRRYVCTGDRRVYEMDSEGNFVQRVTWGRVRIVRGGMIDY